MGFLDQSLAQLEKGLALAERLGHTQNTIHALSFAAEVHHIRRDPQQVEAFFFACSSATFRGSIRGRDCKRLARAAETYWLANHPDEAMALIAEAFDRSDDKWLAPELHRIQGELLLEAGRHNEAEEALRNALSLAREQSARLLQLRAANSLAAFLENRGERAQAYELLHPIYEWFTEGFDTSDLKSAKTLIEQLR